MDLNEKELIEQARMMGVPAHEFSEKFIARDLVEATMTAVRKNTKLKENQEAKLIDDLNDAVKGIISSAVAVIAANGRSAIVTTVKSVMVAGKTIRVVSDVDTGDPQRHALTDTVNHRALLVLAPDEYYDALDSNKPRKDQPDLPLGDQGRVEENDDVPDGDDPLYSEAVNFVLESRRASASAVQRKLKIGYNRAAHMIERMELEGVVTSMNSNGSRDVIGVQDEPVSPYELASIHVTNGGEISAKAIQNAAGVKRKDVADIILALASNGIISDPDDDGLRTLIPADQRPMTAAEVKHGPGVGKEFAEVAEALSEPAYVPQFDEDQYADAVLLVQKERKVSLSFLKSNFSIDEATAEAMIFRMEQDGVVSGPNDIGGRAIYD